MMLREKVCNGCRETSEDVALMQRAIDYINGAWRDAGP